MKRRCAIAAVLLLCMISIPSGEGQAAEKMVRLTTLNWEPYIGQDIPGKGYVYELVSQVFASAGYEVRISFYPWARALDLVMRGKADGIFPEYFDPEARGGAVVFSDSFPGGPVGLMKRSSDDIAYATDPRTDQLNALKGLHKYRFGVVRGYLNTPVFDASDFLHKEEAVDDYMNIVKLINGRIDLIFIDRYVAEYIIRTKLPGSMNRVEFMKPEIEMRPLYIAFSRKAPGYIDKLRDFNKGLAAHTKSGRLRDLLKLHGFADD